MRVKNTVDVRKQCTKGYRNFNSDMIKLRDFCGVYILQMANIVIFTKCDVYLTDFAKHSILCEAQHTYRSKVLICKFLN